MILMYSFQPNETLKKIDVEIGNQVELVEEPKNWGHSKEHLEPGFMLREDNVQQSYVRAPNSN